jgi:Ca2+-binding RTX toxin-like protein
MHISMPAGPRRRTRRALIAAAAPLAVAAVALPSAAQAATISFTDRDGNLGVTDTGAENNNLLLRVIGDQIVITDTVPFASFPASQACRLVNQRQVSCFAPLVNNVSIFTFGGRDSVEYRLPHPGHVNLGADSDRIIAGTRQAIGRAIAPVTYAGKFAISGDAGPGLDTIDYSRADRGVTLDPADGLASDGRPGDLENVNPQFDVIVGSQFDDTLFGSDRDEILNGMGGNDILAGGKGNDLFQTYIRDGADDYDGGPGVDAIDYFSRTRGVAVDLDNRANDGESDERDNVRANVENIYGTNFGDVFDSLGTHSRLDGRGGNDILRGHSGPDTLIGGPGEDQLDGGRDNDLIDSRDGQLDTIDCSDGTDTLTRDSTERRVLGCEKVTVGKLSLTPKSTTAAVGKTCRLELSWRHPQAWKQLRTIELRLTHDGVPVGTVTFRARGKRIAGSGAITLVPKASRLTRAGKTVTARLAVRLDGRVAGDTLKAEVEATDTRGRRQLERNAATIRLAK